jgi:hypothetical protein
VYRIDKSIDTKALGGESVRESESDEKRKEKGKNI